jgi:hypothetical protein
MRQNAETPMPGKSRLTSIKAMNKAFQKPQVFETLFDVFMTFQKVRF